MLRVLTSAMLALFPVLFASGINTTSGNLYINLNSDGTREMTLSPQGLGLGITVPSNNLSVTGNGIVSTNVFIGATSTTGNSIIEISGSMGYNSQTVSSDKYLSGNTMILADSSSANIGLFLPTASTARGRIYNIKKTSTANEVFVAASTSGTGSSGNIDNNSVISLNSGNTGYLNLVSSGSNWHVISNIDSSSGSESINIASSLVGWWKLDETSGTTAEDSSSSSKDGTLNSSTFAANTVTGKVDTGISFTGTSNIHFPATTAIVSTPFSLAFWYMDTGSSPGAGIIGKYRKPYGDYNTEVDWHFAFAPVSISGNAQLVGSGAAATGFASVPWPDPHQADDIAILLYEANGAPGNGMVLSTSSGFSLIVDSGDSGTGAGSCRLRLYWCRATSSNMANPITTDCGDHAAGMIVVFRGLRTSGNPWSTTAASVDATADTSLSIGAITTTYRNSIILYGVASGADGGNTPFGANTPVNATLDNLELQGQYGFGTNAGGGIAAVSGNLAVPGSTGTLTSTMTSAKNAWCVMDLLPETLTKVGSGNISLLISNAAGSSWTEQTVLAPTSNTWYHMACTYDGATAKAFVNGAMVATEAWANTPGTEYHLRVSGNGDSLFGGKLDDIRLYNAALGANVIDVLYHLGNASL